jgi:outer membrane protein assembly factor BamE (lipoprotein component of BamABCDE complex)
VPLPFLPHDQLRANCLYAPFPWHIEGVTVERIDRLYSCLCGRSSGPEIMMSVSSTRALGLGLILALAASACTPLRSHQGYVVDTDLVNSIQPGVDNRQSVLQTLGTPTISSQFGGGDWYYVARDSRNLGYTLPKPVSQITLQISFDQAGNVTTIRRAGVDRVADINPYGKTTPTLGRQRGFFQDLFGNIGAVGAPGAGGGQGGGMGGGRTRP